MENKIIIESEMFSKKNSKRLFTAGNGKIFLVPSKAYKTNEKFLIDYLCLLKNKWFEMIKNTTKPLKIHFIVYRKSRIKTDINNICQGLFDCMVSAGWLEDDNGWVFCPIYHPLQYDKNNPRVVLWVDEPNLTLDEQFEKYK